MTIVEIYERVVSPTDGGFVDSGNRFDKKAVYSMINTAAAQVKREEFLRTKRIHSSWMLPFYPQFNESSQISTCYWSFKLPQIIALDSRQTGIGYIGSIDCNNPYRLVENRSKFATMQKHRMMKNRGNTVMLANGFLELYGDAKEIAIDGLWFSPELLPNFNIEQSQYPIEASLVPRIKALIQEADLNLALKTKQDLKQDFIDQGGLPNIQR